MKNLNLDESVKSSEFTGSIEPSDNLKASKKVIENQSADLIQELSNTSFMNGYDLATTIVKTLGFTDAVNALDANRNDIENGLYKIQIEK